MALVGILTAIESIKASINSNFTRMGANTFTIRNRSMRIHMGERSDMPKDFRIITYEEALEFKKPISISVFNFYICSWYFLVQP